MAAKPKRWFVYLAECADGSLYSGTAVDVTARIRAHNAGKGARYTRGRGPLIVRATYRCQSQSHALRLELAIKRLPKAKKLALGGKRKLGAFARRFFAD